MIGDSGGGGATPFLVFLAGGLAVAVVVLGVFIVGGNRGSPASAPSHLSFNAKSPGGH